MLSQVLRNRLEGEASVGHEHSLPSSTEEAHSNCVSNVRTSHKGELGWSGSHTAEFDSVSRIHQPLLPRGRAVCANDSNAHIKSMTCLSGSGHFERCELLSGGGCMENATTQLIRLFGAYKREKSRRGGKISIKLG